MMHSTLSLVGDLPQGADAVILLLGGDALNILYTVFFDRGLPERNLEITACDADEHIIARNILLFTLLLDKDENVSRRQIWNIYYHFYLDDSDTLLVGRQAKKLISLSQTVQDWHASSYGATLRFCDETTRSLVRHIWAKYAEGAQRDPHRDQDHWRRFNDRFHDLRIKNQSTKLTLRQDVSRSCAPLAMEIAQDLVFPTEHYWNTGLAGSVTDPTAQLNKTRVFPNPVFAVPLTSASAFKFPTNPLLSFHLAAAYANLVELSPLRLQEEDAQDRLLEMALMQFELWTDAFVEASTRTIIRFTAFKDFALDLFGPKKFDVIYAANDDVSVLNVMSSAGPLLKDSPSSTLYTGTIEAETLVGWYAKRNSTFQGLVPAEYWTNAKTSATAHQLLAACSDAPPDARDTLFGYRLAWKQSRHMGGHIRALNQPSASEDAAPPDPTYDTAETGAETTDTSAITGRINITSPQGQKLLADKAPIKLEQPSPFTIDIVFGNDRALVLPLAFPAPILKDGSKTRIARTSHYIEITAPLAEPSTFPRPLDDFLFPTTLDPSTGTPATFNIPHLNLDTLPILSIAEKSRIRFLTTLTSLMFSTRERRLREEFSAANPSGLSPSPRLNFKESLFTIFMLASGLQGGQTGLFALTHPQRGGIHMLLFVSAIRLDGAHGSVVLDAAVLPFTKGLVESGVLEGFLLVLRTLECCSLTIDDEELVLWKKVLPAMAERCRTWVHDPEGCEYRREGRVPVSLGEGEQVLCGCGMDKLPGEFVSLPEWETAAQYATRVAISPVYASPLVEELIAPDLAKAMAEELAGKVVVPKCRNCGRAESEEVKLKKCMRCLAVMYCSAECQKKDWKKHRMECEESEEHYK